LDAGRDGARIELRVEVPPIARVRTNSGRPYNSILHPFSTVTFSHAHHPLSKYFSALASSGFVVHCLFGLESGRALDQGIRAGSSLEEDCLHPVQQHVEDALNLTDVGS